MSKKRRSSSVRGIRASGLLSLGDSSDDSCQSEVAATKKVWTGEFKFGL